MSAKSPSNIFLNPSEADPEKHEKFTQSKFDIFFMKKPLSGFYKRNCMQYEEIYTGLGVFPGWLRSHTKSFGTLLQLLEIHPILFGVES